MHLAHSVFFIEDYTCMNSVLCWDCNIIIFLFTVQKCGPRKSAECAQWGKLCCCTTNFYAEITSCRDFMTPEGIRLILGTEVQYARLHEQCYTTVTCGWKLSGSTFD